MSAEDAKAFQQFLRAGLEQYGMKPGDVGPLVKKKPTPEDLFGERIGISRRVAPLRQAGYRTRDKIKRLIENALSRRVTVTTAQLALLALEQSQAAANWRRVHGWAADRWFDEREELQRKGVPWAQIPWPKNEPSDPLDGAVAAILPGAVETIAKTVVQALYGRKLLTKPKMAEAERLAAAALRRRLGPWLRSFADWLAWSEATVAVDVVEEERTSNPEGATYKHVTYAMRSRYESKDKRPEGARDANHHEFLRVVLGNFINKDAASRTKRRAPRNKPVDVTAPRSRR